MRTYVVTGAASGMGAAATALLRDRGHRVIGVDLHASDVQADLSTRTGPEAMADAVAAELDGQPLDGVIACAGLSLLTVQSVQVNFYGAIGTLNSLRRLQHGAAAPRSVVTASMAVLFPRDEELVELLLDGSEAAALAHAEALAASQDAVMLYASAKRALARWLRRVAPGPEWAGAGIPLNAIAPGIVDTPMMAPTLANDTKRESLVEQVPMPLGGMATATDMAHLLIWLAGEENSHLCGQVIFADGGADAVVRSDDVF